MKQHKAIKRAPKATIAPKSWTPRNETEDADYRAAYLLKGTKFKGEVKAPKNPFDDDPIPQHTACDEPWQRFEGGERR